MTNEFHENTEFRLKCLLLGFCLLIFASCTHRPLYYQAEVKNVKGDVKTVLVIEKEPYYGHASLCAITAIAAGGWCWFYLFTPTFEEMEKPRLKGKGLLSEAFEGEGYFTIFEKSGYLDWNNDSTFVEVADDRINLSSAVKPSVDQTLANNRWAISMDLGTDHSGYGIGPRLSWFSANNEVFLAYGHYAKHDIIGKPWSIGYSFHFDNLFTSLGFSYFQGMGLRNPVYQDGYIGEQQSLKWQMTFVNLSVGTYLDIFKNDRLFMRLETGFSNAIQTKITSANEEPDVSTVGGIKGVSRKDVVRETENNELKRIKSPQKFSQGEGAPYVQLGFTYKI